MRKPELLSPAGSWDAMVAAVQCGADAVYLGAGDFNARQPAENFGADTLKDAVRYCALRQVRVYVTLNTMVLEEELNRLNETIDLIAASGAHGVLVQDFGVLRLVKKRVPKLPVHASTQMAAHNVSGVRFLRAQGFSRVVLAREMPIEEIRACANLGVEIEVFAHGALCVSGSGQCLFSSMIGGRSANRGRCAQPCRLPYRLGSAEGHLLSCRDLCAVERLGELIDAGVHSLKLEGRLKRPEYVAAVTQVYRKAIDHPEDAPDVEALKQMFNRGGFTTGYLFGVEETSLIDPTRPNHAGLEIGFCKRDGRVTLQKDVEKRDALVLRRNGEDTPTNAEGKQGETIACREAKKGDKLIRLVSHRQMENARAAYEKERRVTALQARLKLHVGERAELTVSGGEETVHARGEIVERAMTRGVDPARAKAQIDKTGGTPWRFSSIETDVDGDAFVSMAALNALRRDALLQWESLNAPKPYAVAKTPEPSVAATNARLTALAVESGDPSILAEALRLGADKVVYSPRDLRSPDAPLPERFALRLPSMLPGDSQEKLHAFARAHADQIEATILNNVGSFEKRWFGRVVAGEGLNLANSFAVEQALQWGADGYIPSLELTSRQIDALSVPDALIVYGSFTLMCLRHCPHRTAHGAGGRHDACRRCDAAPETERLIDRKGARFPLKRIATDSGCVLELQNNLPLMLLKHLGQLPRARSWILRVDDPALLPDALRLHRMALSGEPYKTDPVWETFASRPSTTGHYFRPVE